MTKQVQRRRGTSTQHTSFTGAEGEISVNTTNKSIHVHDGTTAGGVEAARADLANVSDTSLNNALSGNTLASLTITSADINGGTVDGAVIGGSSAAAITGTTITATGDVTITDKIIHSGDTDTAIRFPAADTVTVETSGTERFRVSDIGNVGIGRTPEQVLDIQTSGIAVARIRPASGSGAGWFVTQPGVDTTLMAFSDKGLTTGGTAGSIASVFTSTSIPLIFEVSASEKMRIDTSGNVGIGTSSPDARLRVAGAVNSLQARFSNVDGRGLAISTFNSTSTNDNGVIYNAGVFADAQHVWQCGATERMRIDASGNVGIGTSSPYADTGYQALDIRGSTGAQIQLGTTSGREGEISSNATSGLTLNTINVTPIRFFTNGNERMRIDASGNLGLGVTPSAWNSAFKAIEIGRLGDALFSGSGGGPVLSANGYYASDVWRYGRTGSAAANYDMNAGTHKWYIAPSGTAGNAITFTQAMTLDASGNLGIGVTSPQARLQVASFTASSVLKISNTTTGSAVGDGLDLIADGTDAYVWNRENGPLMLGTNNTERVRIDSSGNLLVGTTSTSPAASNVTGVSIRPGGFQSEFTGEGGPGLAVNRKVNDGDLVRFHQDGTQEGSISVSGTTVSYNGGHLSRWAQFPDNSRPELLKGTVMSNLDQMSNWDGEDNEQLNCVQVSAVEGDANVAGVFVAWDSTDDGYNDILLAMTGDMVIRIAGGTNVQRGDLLMSAGDGTAKPQGDDIVRSKTIAKVTSTHVSHTYADGSYAVPCVLMAC
jgi:hypothetical protein